MYNMELAIMYILALVDQFRKLIILNGEWGELPGIFTETECSNEYIKIVSKIR